MTAGWASGIVESKPLAGGNSGGKRELLTFGDGSRAVLQNADKRKYDQYDLHGALVEAMGGESAAVVRVDTKRMLVEYVEGTHLARTVFGEGWKEEVAAHNEIKDKFGSEASAIWLADLVSDNDDRHSGNWVLRGGRPVSIDLGRAGFTGAHQQTHNDVQGHSVKGGTFDWASKSFTPLENVAFREQLAAGMAAVRKDFEDAGRSTWFDNASKLAAELGAVIPAADSAAQTPLPFPGLLIDNDGDVAGVSANQYGMRFHMAFDSVDEAKAVAALFPKSLRVSSGKLGTQGNYYQNSEHTGNFSGGHVSFDVSLKPTAGNDVNEGGINRYRKFVEVADKLGIELAWKGGTIKSREEFEKLLPAPAPKLTGVPAAQGTAAKMLAPVDIEEAELPSVKVAGVKRIPMEFKEAPVSQIDAYIADDSFAFQQKVDGIRAQLSLEPGVKPWFRSKSGDKLVSSSAAKVIDPIVKKMGAGLPEGSPAVSIDGEVLDGKWYIFDMVVAGQEGLPWEERMAMAEKWVASLNEQGVTSITALPTARTPAEKRALYDAVHAGGGEGVMMKRLKGKYKFGQRTDEVLKAKITTTADVVVMDRNVEGKVNAVVGVYKNGKLTRVANIPMQGKADAQVGDVVEVEYLWAHKGSGLLTQARMKKIRPDKKPTDSTDSQFRFVDKTVLDLPAGDAPEPSGEVKPAEITPAPDVAKPWQSAEAQAELAALRTELEEVRRLEDLYEQWAENRGVAKQVGGSYDSPWKAMKRDESWKAYKAAREAFKPKNEAWREKYSPEWPSNGVGVDDHWDNLGAISTGAKTDHKLSKEAWDKIRDMYVVKDPQTIMHNASLRTPAPSSASKTWRSKVTRMVNAQRTMADTQVYRVAAFTPDFAAQLVPGARITDPGFTSVGEDPGSGQEYADVRLAQNAGAEAYYFHIQVPKGTPAASVGYSEVVLDYGNTMEVLRVGMVDGRRTVVVRLVPKAQAAK